MDDWQTKRLSDAEAHALFDRLCPHGYASPDVLEADLEEANARAREAAMDRPPPATVRAYRQVYGRDPRGWPPL